MDYYKWFKDGKGNRDPIFKELLSFLNGKPANILEIGTMRSIDERSSGGASTFFWAEYIKSYGGNLHVCDTDATSLSFSSNALSGFYDKATYYLDIGVNVLKKINKKWDIVYLDGGNDAHEMLEEYQNCSSRFVLCDDFSDKGLILRLIYPNYRLYKWGFANHELALYGEGIKRETIYLEPIS